MHPSKTIVYSSSILNSEAIVLNLQFDFEISKFFNVFLAYPSIKYCILSTLLLKLENDEAKLNELKPLVKLSINDFFLFSYNLIFSSTKGKFFIFFSSSMHIKLSNFKIFILTWPILPILTLYPRELS